MGNSVDQLVVVNLSKNHVGCAGCKTKNGVGCAGCKMINGAGCAGCKTIFDLGDIYRIPLYQRAFAWEEKQLVQFVEDMEGIEEDAHYYLGSLIVSRSAEGFEVVDGQQRLTALYLLLSCLGIKPEPALTFVCRDKSNYTLNHLQVLLEGKRDKFDADRIDEGLYQGMKILNEAITREGFDRDGFLEKLGRVILYRIEVPENTDLNRYFEIMNTRGEQLEQHDIVKARLMSFLPTEGERTVFAKIWEACSDMTGYVQMHFTVQEREWIFGSEWQALPSFLWGDLQKIAGADGKENPGFFLADMVKRNFRIPSAEVSEREEGSRVRFESIIEFPYFLLHVLKVFLRIYSVTDADNRDKALLPELLDDKKLIDSFTRVIQKGRMGRWRIAEERNKKIFSRRFIVCLLRSRFLFDKYILKREYTYDDSDGEWSLKELRITSRMSKKRPYYTNTCFIQGGEGDKAADKWAKINDRQAKINVMLQSALRVSYTSPKVMHWITDLLYWLMKGQCANICEEALAEYEAEMERIAIDAVKENFFDLCPEDEYFLGTDTPHIVLNYLDFLLWKENPRKYSDFTFEFRNSVEHWYPRNPSEGTFEPWDDGVDRFGNLCLIQRSVNARFSNMSPEAKKDTFEETIARGSIKLRLMSEQTKKKGKKTASAYWKDTACKEHEEEMLWKLKDACGIE